MIIDERTALTFEQAHPFVLRDQRRFASLYCAALTATADGISSMVPIKDESSGIEYGAFECKAVLSKGPNGDQNRAKPLSAYSVCSTTW